MRSPGRPLLMFSATLNAGSGPTSCHIADNAARQRYWFRRTLHVAAAELIAPPVNVSGYKTSCARSDRPGRSRRQLPEREREVLRGIARGRTNAEIAAALYVLVRTIETHRTPIQQKLDARTRAELVERAGLVGGGTAARPANAGPARPVLACPGRRAAWQPAVSGRWM